MRYVKVFEAWSEEKEEEVSHQDLYEMLEELVNAWKEWKENDDEDKDEEELHDEFMEKVEGLIERAKEIVEEEEEEEEESEEMSEEEPEEQEEESEEDEDEEEEETEEVEEGRLPDLSPIEGSLSYMLEPLIGMMDSMPYEQIKAEFMAILDSPELKASKETRMKNKQRALASRGKYDLMRTITNIYLKGSALGANPDDY